MTTNITFSYTPPAGHPNDMPKAIAWITTDADMDGQGHTIDDVPISWDMDTRIYKITSEAGHTEIEAHSSKAELHEMGDAAAGDYVATRQLPDD